MLSVKAGMIVLLLSLILNGAGSCDAKRSGNEQSSNQSKNSSVPANRQPDERDRGAMNGELKTLAQGQQSSIANAFIAVARDADTYALMRNAIRGLPEVNEEFFKANAVVAAFLGERRTGGYSVRFTRAGDGSIRVEETSPGRGMMSIQVITSPFMVVAVPIKNQESLALDVGNSWRAMIRPYRVKGVDFTMSGGFTGRSEKFGIAGSVGVMREGNLATLFFDLRSEKGAAKPRALKDVSSGILQSNGRFALAHLGAGSFVDQPADALRATGAFAENESKLSLTFDSIPGNIADGYSGKGNLEAEATAPAPQKKTRSMEDLPQ